MIKLRLCHSPTYVWSFGLAWKGAALSLLLTLHCQLKCHLGKPRRGSAKNVQNVHLSLAQLNAGLSLVTLGLSLVARVWHLRIALGSNSDNDNILLPWPLTSLKVQANGYPCICASITKLRLVIYSAPTSDKAGMVSMSA